MSKRDYIKRILTVFLSLVMTVTYMPARGLHLIQRTAPDQRRPHLYARLRSMMSSSGSKQRPGYSRIMQNSQLRKSAGKMKPKQPRLLMKSARPS